ncbi:MAG: cupin domain-containing protein [Ginsengibacter sp.]
MSHKINKLFIFVLGISILLAACGQGGKQGETTTATDSTSTTMTDAVQQTALVSADDAVKAAPDLYKVVNDSLGIRILEATYKPGDSSAMHSHPDYSIYVIDGGTAEFTSKDGQKRVSEMKPGMENIIGEEVHSVKNIGKTTVKVLVFEVNRAKTVNSPDAALDAAKVASDLYKVKRDSLGIRVVEATYKPGQSSAMHIHPDNGVYAISGGTGEFTEKDGTKRTNELKTGLAFVTGGGEHSVKNVGKTTMKILLIEINRPMK